MKIKLQYSFLTIEYTEAIPVQKNFLLKNNLLAVDIFKDQTLLGRIDFSALPHFHQYSLEEWQYSLERFFNQAEISFEQISLSAPYFNMVVSDIVFSGELLFAVESVLFLLIEKYSPETLAFIENREIALNSFYSKSINIEDIGDCLKIKIRPSIESLEETKTIILDLLNKRPSIKFRLDGNRLFELRELSFFMTELKSFCGNQFNLAIEYLEEPLINHYDYYNFSDLQPYAVALDESISPYIENPEYLKKLPANTFFVLKPSLYGISKSFRFMNAAFKLGQQVVISSTFETASAIKPLLYLAASNPFTHHGLDTLKFLPNEYSKNTADFTLVY